MIASIKGTTSILLRAIPAGVHQVLPKYLKISSHWKYKTIS